MPLVVLIRCVRVVFVLASQQPNTNPLTPVLQDIRIKHTYVLEDPFADPPGLEVPDESPDPSQRRPKAEVGCS